MTHRTRIDSRTVKTRERIRETLRCMILEMNYNDITVTELTSRVGIHRKTFYLYYESIDSLFSELESNIINQINDMIIKSMNDSSTIDFEIINYYLNALIDTDNLLYRRLFFTESYQIVYAHIYSGLTRLITPYVKQTFRISIEEAIIVTNFILTCCFEVIRNCQKNNLNISDEKLNRMLFSLINTGISNM